MQWAGSFVVFKFKFIDTDFEGMTNDSKHMSKNFIEFRTFKFDKIDIKLILIKLMINFINVRCKKKTGKNKKTVLLLTMDHVQA